MAFTWDFCNCVLMNVLSATTCKRRWLYLSPVALTVVVRWGQHRRGAQGQAWGAVHKGRACFNEGWPEKHHRHSHPGRAQNHFVIFCLNSFVSSILRTCQMGQSACSAQGSWASWQGRSPQQMWSGPFGKKELGEWVLWQYLCVGQKAQGI